MVLFLTVKGHGYAPAVENKEAWHWGLPFNLDDGSRPVRNADGTLPEVVPSENYQHLFSDWMLREMKHDHTLIAVTAGTPAAAGFTPEKRKEAGKQHIDMGIAEEQAVAMISGMAKGGLHPVWTVYSTFIQRTYDQIAQDLCINANPAVINVVGGGVNSMNDITHICLFDIPMLCSIPGLVYLAPMGYPSGPHASGSSCAHEWRCPYVGNRRRGICLRSEVQDDAPWFQGGCHRCRFVLSEG